MYGLLKFIIKNYFTILFLILEIIAVSLAVSFNKHQNAIFFSSANTFTSSINEKVFNLNQYLSLKEENEKLLKQNAILMQKSQSNYLNNKKVLTLVIDSVNKLKYKYTDAQVIKNSVYFKHNYLTLNKGKLAGVTQESGVISSDGVVGVVTKVSDNFSSVISLLNTELYISAKIKRDNYFGSINWDGNDYRYVKLKEIPFHVDLQKGDTVVTSGYSYIFPPNIPIGVISDFTKQTDGNFYDITVKLLTNFKKIENVYVITNLKREELKSIEENND